MSYSEPEIGLQKLFSFYLQYLLQCGRGVSQSFDTSLYVITNSKARIKKALANLRMDDSMNHAC